MIEPNLPEPEGLLNQVPSGEELVAMFLNEHSFDSGFENKNFVIKVSGVEIPPLDPNCLFCDTPLKKMGDAGWQHLAHAKERNFCQFPWPGEGLEFMNIQND